MGCLGSADDEDAGGAGGFAAGANFDDYIVFEGCGEVHEALDGEAFELVALQGGDFGLVDAEEAGGFGLSEFAVGEDFVDDDAEAELGVEFFGVGQAEVGKHVARTDFCDHSFLRFRHSCYPSFRIRHIGRQQSHISNARCGAPGSCKPDLGGRKLYVTLKIKHLTCIRRYWFSIECSITRARCGCHFRRLRSYQLLPGGHKYE